MPIINMLSEQSRFKVFKAYNGIEAVKKFKERIHSSCNNLNCTKYDFKIILMDLQMPMKDGFEACEEILNYQKYLIRSG